MGRLHLNRTGRIALLTVAGALVGLPIAGPDGSVLGGLVGFFLAQSLDSTLRVFRPETDR